MKRDAMLCVFCQITSKLIDTVVATPVTSVEMAMDRFETVMHAVANKTLITPQSAVSSLLLQFGVPYSLYRKSLYRSLESDPISVQSSKPLHPPINSYTFLYRLLRPFRPREIRTLWTCKLALKRLRSAGTNLFRFFVKWIAIQGIRSVTQQRDTRNVLDCDLSARYV